MDPICPRYLLGGQWHMGTPPAECDAVVVYTDEPDPDTGHVGWCWWVEGRQGDAATREDAMAAAERVLARRAA